MQFSEAFFFRYVGPRIALVSLLYFLQRSNESSLPAIVFVSGIIRTLSCGGWVYITSSDDHDAHDIFMITYIVLNLPWMVGGIYSTTKKCPSVRKKRWALQRYVLILKIERDNLHQICHRFSVSSLKEPHRTHLHC